MANQHAKCPRCQRRGSRWGNRRRRCKVCNITWRIRKKKRGRKRLRITAQGAIQYLQNQEIYASRFTEARRAYRRLLSRDMLRTHLPWPKPPRAATLILIADAFLQRVEHVWHTWYCILVRASTSEDAVILPPFCRQGTEVALGWHEAFTALPSSILKRAMVLVCDGHNGLILEARRRGWLIQRCHFHILARLQSHRSRWRQSRHLLEGKIIHALVTKILTARSEKGVLRSLSQLTLLGSSTTSPDIRRVISGLLTNYREYRTYLYYPELYLPKTSNTAESFIGLIRKVCQRAHGFRTLHSLQAWIEAFVKIKKTIKCRWKNQPN